MTYAYLLKISVAHNKKQITSLNLLINCLSVRSVSQILYLKDKHTFSFLKFSNNYFV